MAAPAPGETITIGFETDAAGVPLPRGTVLAEQYAALGVHFHNGYIIGDRTTDFSNYVDAPTPDNFICTREGGAPGGCGDPQNRPPADASLEFTLDFPACFVSIQGTATIPNSLALFTLVGYDASGYQTALNGTRGFGPVVSYDTATLTWTLVHEAVRTASIPGTLEPAPPPPPLQGLDIHKVDIFESEIGSFDTLTITRCSGLQPKCKNQIACTNSAQQCTVGTTVSVDNGSYDATNGQPVTVSQTPPAPYQLGSTPIALTVTEGATTARCKGSVTVGDCSAPTLACPPPSTLPCAPTSVDCTPYNDQAMVSDSCQSKVISSLSGPCMRVGANTVLYSASSISGATSSCSTTVTVVDDVPPVVMGTGNDLSNPSPLASVDGNLHTVSLNTCQMVASDTCDNNVSLASNAATTITCVSNDEDGCCVRMSDDVQVMDGTLYAALRAKTNAGGVQRVYSIHFEVADRSGNKSNGVCRYVVPGLPSTGLGGHGGATVCPGGGGVGGSTPSGGTAGSSNGGRAGGSGGVSGSGGTSSGAAGAPAGSGGSATGGRGDGATGGRGGSAGAASSGGSGAGTGGSTSSGGVAAGGSAGPGGSPGHGGSAGPGGHGGQGTAGTHGASGGRNGGTGTGGTPEHPGGCDAAGGAPLAPSSCVAALGALALVLVSRRRGAGARQQQRSAEMADR